MNPSTAINELSYCNINRVLEDTSQDYIEPINLGVLSQVSLPKLDPEYLSLPKENRLKLHDTTYRRDIKGQYSFSVLQEWEGYVVSISENTFTARLVDVTRNCFLEEEEADFLLDDLEESDRERIMPGSIFRWVIGYNRSPGGTKDRASRIKLRDVPRWTKKEVEGNRREAAKWSSQLSVE